MRWHAQTIQRVVINVLPLFLFTYGSLFFLFCFWVKKTLFCFLLPFPTTAVALPRVSKTYFGLVQRPKPSPLLNRRSLLLAAWRIIRWLEDQGETVYGDDYTVAKVNINGGYLVGEGQV